MNNRFQTVKNACEVFDIVIDEWCDRERDTRSLPVTKLELKNELGRAMGLGNGDDPNAPAKGVYRYCSGETPLSIDKALLACRYINNWELIQWIGYQGGMLMSPRAVIDDLEFMANEDVFDQIVKCLREVTGFVETLSKTYQSKPCFELIVKIEDVFFSATFQMEKCRLMLRKLVERMIKPGSQGELWFGFESTKKPRKRRKSNEI